MRGKGGVSKNDDSLHKRMMLCLIFDIDKFCMIYRLLSLPFKLSLSSDLLKF